MADDDSINFPAFLGIIIVLVMSLAGFFCGLEGIDRKIAQKNSGFLTKPEEITLGKTTFVLRQGTEVLLTPETKKPFLAVYVPKEEMSDEEADLFYDGLWEYHYCHRGVIGRSPIFVSFTNLNVPKDCYSTRFYCRIKNDWFSFSPYNRTLIVVNEVNLRLYKKEHDKIRNVELKEYWEK